MSHRPDPAEAARLLRQQTELGAPAVFLDGMTRDEALRIAGMLREARRSARASAPVAAGEGAGGARRPVGGVPAEPAGGEAGRDLPVLPADYEGLRAAALGCTRCRLAGSRTHVVFSDGVVDARLAVVGEAPGANEDETGLPFVGAAGQFLDLLLATVDLSRKDSVYICNVLKCRPPGNRNPLPDEIEACAPFLRRQLEIVAPRVLLAVGSFAAQALTGDSRPLGKLRGTLHAYEGIPLVVTYHPAALLRNPGWTRAFWDDLQLLRQVLDGA